MYVSSINDEQLYCETSVLLVAVFELLSKYFISTMQCKGRIFLVSLHCYFSLQITKTNYPQVS